MSNEINRQQSGMEQKINEMVEQSRILEAYMNDIITREATITRLMERLVLLQLPSKKLWMKTKSNH